MAQKGALFQTTVTGVQTGLSGLHSTLTAAYAQAGAQAEAAVAAFEAQYCEPASFTPSELVALPSCGTTSPRPASPPTSLPAYQPCTHTTFNTPCR